MSLLVRGIIAGNDVALRMSVAPQKRRLIAFICPVVKGHYRKSCQPIGRALLREANDAMGPGCVKSRTDAMILFLNRQAGATDVRLCGRD